MDEVFQGTLGMILGYNNPMKTQYSTKHMNILQSRICLSIFLHQQSYLIQKISILVKIKRKNCDSDISSYFIIYSPLFYYLNQPCNSHCLSTIQGYWASSLCTICMNILSFACNRLYKPRHEL